MNKENFIVNNEYNYNPPINGNQMYLPLKDMNWEGFEELCLRMVEYVEGYPISHCNRYGREGQGQEGIDIYAKKGDEKYYTFQCKKYQSITVSVINKIFSEFEKGDWYSKTEKFFICTTADFSDVKLQKRFEEIRSDYKRKNKQVDTWDYSTINRLLKTHPQIVYDFFGKEWCKIFCGEDIYNNSINGINFNETEQSFKKASLFLSSIKNYFEKKSNTHIDRKETKQIIDWVKVDLKHPKKNILILDGEKGMGKSVILKDVYEQLINENYTVLGIKADKYYASNPKELENKIFLNDAITFSKIIKALNSQKKQLIVIIDQLDALSQALSSNREYIQTYNRIINELLDEKNIRIIISSRTYDLQYDAELSVYKSIEYHNIKVSLLDEIEVARTLKKFNISCSYKKVIELLKTPNHLEIFCKLPNKNKINLNALSSLKDLYDMLWDMQIFQHTNLRLSELLYSIAVEMYNKQQITIKDRFSKEFDKEIKFLLSNQLIIRENSEIQFFHQTFYDYCFARQFVENGNDIYSYLNENEQNLEIRSIVKMVFEYLREFNHEKSIENTISILKSSKYRIHIKSLIIGNLGILLNPTQEEKKLIRKYILKNTLYEDIFIHSVFSKEWVEYLIEMGIFTKLLFVKKNFLNTTYNIYKRQSVFHLNNLEKFNLGNVTEYKKNMAWIFFRNNINNAPIQIIEYLDNLSDFPDKYQFIERILIGLDDWKNKQLLPYFSKYFSFNNEEPKGKDNFWFYQVLSKIFEYHDKYVFNLITPIFNHIFYSGDSWHRNEISHDQEELLKKMYNLNPESTYEFIFDVYQKVIEDNMDITGFEKINSPLFKCTKFIDGFSSSKDANILIEEFLVKHLKSKISDKEFIKDFFNKYKTSNSVHILRLIVLMLNNDKPLFVNETYELICIIYEKNGFNGHDDKFQLYLRQLLGYVFTHFSTENKRKVVKILMSIKSPEDLKSYNYKDGNGKEIISFSGFGKKQYYFINQLPKEEIEQILELKKVNQEFYRRFGEINSNKASYISSYNSYSVGPPLSQNAYTNMSLENWKKSITKFDDIYQEDHGPKGGKLEHSRAFEDVVKNNPDKFYNFILDLFDDKNVSIDYISKGINGLINAKFSPIEIKILYKEFIQLNLDTANTLYALWQSEYLIRHKLIDDEIISFLSKNALNHSSPEKPMNENDPSFDSLNTVRGAATHKIMQCYGQKEFEEIIFETVEKAVSDPQTSVRVAVMQELAYLNHLDLNRSFEIFMRLIEKDDIEILKNSFSTSQYFNFEFHLKMYPYFEKIINHKELHKDGNLVVLSWLNDNINDEKLYKKFIHSSNEAKLCAINIAEENLFDENGKANKKSFKILTEFLKEDGEDFSDSYSSLVLRKFKHSNFKDAYSFLIKYSKSKLCSNQPRYFLQLLLNCAKDYPVECLILIQNLDFNEVPNIQNRGAYDKEPVQLILAIYSKLNLDFKNNRKHIKKSLDIFDSMLKYNHLRTSVNQAIELTV